MIERRVLNRRPSPNSGLTTGAVVEIRQAAEETHIERLSEHTADGASPECFKKGAALSLDVWAIQMPAEAYAVIPS